MAVQPTWNQFRFVFALGGATSNKLLGSTTTLLTFIPGTPARITRAAGSFITDGHVGGMYTDVFGSGLNDGRYLLDVGFTFTLRLAPGETLQAEGPVNATVASIFRELDQTESFPSEEHPTTNLVRSGGFDAGFTGIDKPYLWQTMTVTVNNQAADAVYGVSDYHWYLTQRTDDASVQYLSIVQKPDSGGQSFSGTVLIDHTATATAELGITGIPTMAQLRGLFIHTELYCKRVSDGAIQWVDLYREMQAP
jgi:hypothetical protein